MFQYNIASLPLSGSIFGSMYGYGEFSMTLCFDGAIFHDAFEQGNTSAWSTTLG